MRSVNLISALACLLLPVSVWSAELCGPEFTPPFEVKQTKAQPPHLVTSSFLDADRNNQPTDAAALEVGNKRISVRETACNQFTSKQDNGITIFVNNKPVFSLNFDTGYLDSDKKHVDMTKGYKPEDVKLVSDPATGTIRWLRSYPLPDGTRGTFSFQLKPLGEGRVELSIDPGCTEAQREALKINNCLTYFSMPEAYRQAGVEINGALLKPQADDALKAADTKGVAAWQGKLEKLVYNPGKPLDGFTIILPDAPASVCTEQFAYDRYTLGFRTSVKMPGKLIIDLGETSVARKDAPPAVEGNDFWTQDALHFPKSPTRNLFPNPSFEQGMRYWRWWFGGASYTPSEGRRYETDATAGLFGKSALVVNPVQTSSQGLISFSLPGRKGQAYTVSYYAKAEKEGAEAKLALFSTKTGGQFFTRKFGKLEKLTTQWQRFSQTFISDGSPLALLVLVNNHGGKVWLDCIQYEAGDQATEFVSAPLEGRLFTSDPDGNVEFGKKLDAAFEVYGKEGTAGEAEFTLCDFYKKTVWQKTLAVKAGERLVLPFDDLNLAKGLYILRVKYTVPGTEPYFDFYRFTLIESLNGTHATKNLYGALFMTRIDRTEDLLKLMRRCGFGGSTSYGEGKLADPVNYEMREKYNITDYTHTMGDGAFLTAEQARNRFEDPDYRFMMSLNSGMWRRPEMAKEIPWKETYSEEDTKHLEELAFRAATLNPQVRVWSMGTEEEGGYFPLVKRRDFKEFSKLQIAFYHGIKRANPKALVLPSGGTSGFGKLRGKEYIEGYLAATQGQVKWDAVAVHPYGNCDGTLNSDDLDETVQLLSGSMAKYGYGKETPIFLNEGGTTRCQPYFFGDGPDWTYIGGHPSYDQGMHEYLHACTLARAYIICLKYWPRLEHFNTWHDDQRVIVDYNLTPTAAMLGINTLGHLLAKPTFIADIRPASGMRGYAFKDDKGNGVAAIWCTLDNVDGGFERGPEMRVKFKGKMPELFDLMGKQYPVVADADGYVRIQLTSAPLFLRSKSPEKLVAALKDAEVSGAGTSVTTSFLPTLDGKVAAKLENLTGRQQTGEMVIKGQKNSFSIAPMKTVTIPLAESAQPEFGKMFRWSNNYTLTTNGKQEPEKPWSMDYFYVPHVNGAPDWEKIPAIPITNLFRPVVEGKQTPGGQKGDIEAAYKVAWDEKNFYLRVEAEDDVFNPNNPEFWNSPENRRKSLYMLDGCLEVYFDSGANGRLRKGGYDLDDYRYDFCTGNPEGKSGSGLVYRLQEAYLEYAGGVGVMPSKEEAAKQIQCEFTRISPTRYAYTITFEQKHIAPIHLQKGAVAGFALFLHDKMDDGTPGNKGLSLATELGSACDYKPQAWPLMILAE